MTPRRLLVLLVLVSAAVPARRADSQSGPTGAERLAAAESAFAAVRQLKDRLDIITLRAGVANHGADSIRALRRPYDTARARLVAALEFDSLALADSVDRRALATMRRALLADLPTDPASPAGGHTAGGADSCRYDPVALLAGRGEDALSARLYHCFGAAARQVEVGGEQLTRLTVVGRLAQEPDAARRRQLFLALQPIWQAVNGGPVSPYRTLLTHRALAWSEGRRPYQRSAAQTGILADTVVAWLEAVLEAWRRATPDTSTEPWDLYFDLGQAARRLSRRIPRDSLLALNRRYYRDLGADPDSLGVHYDILPRVGKGPVAFTTIGRRAGAGVRPESWVFTTYADGGFDNMEELFHETGHGIHLAGLRTRPAFTDWPASDIFTEAIADVAALEVYEPAWQFRYLGDSTDLTAALRAKYFGIMMDVAWALFEIRLERNPTADPDQVWADLTSRYLHAAPHPELSWWAMRGQLIEETGYMLNYALGAILVADVRAQIARKHGPFTLGDPTWYGYLQREIYRFGLERSASRVVADFLGRQPSPRALLDDLGRIPAR